MSASEHRVLIVEDDETRCAWFRERLRGSQLDVTCDVPTALRWLGERDYKAVLLDHDLTEEHYFSNEPDDERTGYAVARWVRSRPWGTSARLLAVTGWGQAQDRALARAAGFDEHLVKPVDPNALLVRLREVYPERSAAS